MQSLLEDIVQQVQPLIGQGKVADYIPALAKVKSNSLGMAVYTASGEIFKTGDADTPFSIQSISKVLSLIMALDLYGESLWERVGREPSGQAFNSIIELELKQGVPRNPFINAGAIQICDMLQSRYVAPKQRIKELVWQLSGNKRIFANKEVADSEMEFGSRSAAMAHLLKAFNNFHNPVDKVLSTYFHACSLEMSCVDLAKTMSFLANHGRSVVTQNQIVSARESKQINALLATCGLYDEAGEFAYRVGMSGKSGVGGGIIAVIPGELSVCVWSPELNKAGNSLAGSKALELFTTSLGRSIY